MYFKINNYFFSNLGYVRNVMTNDHFRFVNAGDNRRWWTYLVALCIMIVFVSKIVFLIFFKFPFYSIIVQTVSISMLLRYSHFQIFLFISK